MPAPTTTKSVSWLNVFMPIATRVLAPMNLFQADGNTAQAAHQRLRMAIGGLSRIDCDLAVGAPARQSRLRDQCESSDACC
jgi:hypothetical protein